MVKCATSILCLIYFYALILSNICNNGNKRIFHEQTLENNFSNDLIGPRNRSSFNESVNRK